MSQKSRTNKNSDTLKPRNGQKNKAGEVKSVCAGEIVTCLLALPTVFVLISLTTYYYRFFSDVKNIHDDFFTGSLGYGCARIFDNFFGIFSFYIPLAVIAFVIMFFLKRKLWKHILLNMVNFIVLVSFSSMIIDTYSLNKTNWTGHALYQDFLERYIGRTGFILFFVCWAVLFIILAFHVSFVKLCAGISLALKKYFSMNSTVSEVDETEKTKEEPEHSNSNYIDLSAVSKEIAQEEVASVSEVGIPLPEEFDNENTEEENLSVEETAEKEIHEETAENIEEIEQNQTGDEIEVKTSDINEAKTNATVLRKLKDYHLPPLSLLATGENLEKSEKREREVAETCRIIARKLGEHRIKVEVKGATIGPLVTMYEIELGEGVKVSQVLGMEPDLTVAVSGKKVRIVGFIPGKPYIGIEVPNDERLTIRLKSVLESSTFSSAAKKGLPIALGLDVAGKPCAANLNKMPHILVAGTTGSGKSVGINSFIISLLYTLTPDEVKFIMIDPKGNEFNMYEGIPHMLLPVVVDSRKAAKALQWAVVEMDNRFRILAENKVKDIGEYNQKVEEINKNLASEEAYLKKMPFIVVVIDEFADLMMVAGKDVETAVARIAQKARAVGIHLIIATQKPTRDVVTGLIKSNLPVRIAFKVASAMDSRVILDTNGAEALLGNGDMLYIAPGTSIPTRIHGAFVSTSEMEAVIDFIKEEAGGEVHPEDILENFLNESSGGSGSAGVGDDSEEEPLYNEIIEFITETGKCSASMLQRKFSIGYNRAARIVDRLEAEGIVSSGEGAKPRTVIGRK
ncbi:hypothetical protein J6Z19_07440 [bacterium]|nr:hypothetical protein [bacterium]